jgi:DNA-binding LacI/PurR family transcriptional regulator
MSRPSRKYNIYQIAEEAGMSIATVSNTINNRAGVSESTRRHINGIIEKYDYTRSYKRNGNRKIGIVLRSRNLDWYAAELLNGIMTFASEYGINTAAIVYCPGGSQSILDMLRENRCDAAVVTESSHLLNELQSLESINIPIVLTDARLEGQRNIGYVDNDSYQGASDMAQYLTSLGHHRIGFIARDDLSDQNSLSRIKAWQDVMSSACPNESMSEHYLFRVKDTVAEMLDSVKNILVNNNQMTAVMTNDDEIALVCMCACHELGLRIPEDISVTGFDNMKLSEFFYPPLTTVNHDIVNIGYEAARYAAEITLETRKELPRVVAPVKLVIRKSSGPARSAAMVKNLKL